MTVKMTADDLQGFLAETFPQVQGDFVIAALAAQSITVQMPVADRHLRPGGTVSGPAMFALADVTAYLIILANIGPKALAVTTNCSIDFMRKPAAGQMLICEARLLKLGRALAVVDALIYSAGQAAPVARASLTYAIPPG
ncbi:PaaI family thioesterase [Yoonia vestfoldensis]|uniref:Thioesterase superfamily protein n=1 Tax=Yoonia vestfoldensis TaxID=245188 RepID=A0A1Y0EAW0_9RHOB|nr:PaaI family thioesterase [Yoonia vestfoldensis]ARU00764.1 thioesterase superfamily protein [Yoonia vestfoldensis]